jgi:hypothetical protein
MTPEERIAGLHKRAMDMAENADFHRHDGMPSLARDEMQEAYRCERLAADLCLTTFAPEPTRSVILRSAASLAIQVGEWVEAYHLVAAGLQGDELPDEANIELMRLLGDIEVHWREACNA